jgi:hypothetical protein
MWYLLPVNSVPGGLPELSAMALLVLLDALTVLGLATVVASLWPSRAGSRAGRRAVAPHPACAVARRLLGTRAA